jgi:hypothetical protein
MFKEEDLSLTVAEFSGGSIMCRVEIDYGLVLIVFDSPLLVSIDGDC